MDWALQGVKSRAVDQILSIKAARGVRLGEVSQVAFIRTKLAGVSPRAVEQLLPTIWV